MTFKEFLQTNGIAFVARTASGNGINFRTASGIQVATIILNNETPAEEDLFSYVEDHLSFTCTVRGNFITLAEVKKGVSVEALWNEPAPVKAKAKA